MYISCEIAHTSINLGKTLEKENGGLHNRETTHICKILTVQLFKSQCFQLHVTMFYNARKDTEKVDCYRGKNGFHISTGNADHV